MDKINSNNEIFFTETSQKRILIFEDEADIVKILSIRLEDEGYKVLSAYDCVLGLEKVKRAHPHLIVLDVMLPKVDGYEFCRRLKKHPNYSRIPVVMLSARYEDEFRQKGLESGADEYIGKNCEDRELLERIQKFLK